ncbi:MAG: hypothetical protein M1608_16075 [Candidatus Omnitrophica bacterium]|nr:hypothetical protein [Candidatus Omnitrophota bacterium]
MKSIANVLATAAMAGFVALPAAIAQSDPQTDDSRPEPMLGRIYNPQTVETVKGEVVKVERVTSKSGMGFGIHLLVKTSKETLPVFLGPAWFIDHQETRIKPGDEVAIKGSCVTYQGQPAIVAAVVTKGDEILRLRNDQGYPAWAGWRPASGPREGAPMMGRQGMMGGGGMMGRQGMMGGGPGMAPQRQWSMPREQEMKRNVQEMMADHKRMLRRLRAMEDRLDDLVDRMNEAQGEAKVDAMADVVNELVKEHERVLNHFAAMQESMITHMQKMHEMREMEHGWSGREEWNGREKWNEPKKSNGGKKRDAPEQQPSEDSESGEE